MEKISLLEIYGDINILGENNKCKNKLHDNFNEIDISINFD